jgi:hypothetical protein
MADSPITALLYTRWSVYIPLREYTEAKEAILVFVRIILCYRAVRVHFFSHKIAENLCTLRINQLESWDMFRSTKINALGMWNVLLRASFFTHLPVKLNITVPRIMECPYLFQKKPTRQQATSKISFRTTKPAYLHTATCQSHRKNQRDVTV